MSASTLSVPASANGTRPWLRHYGKDVPTRYPKLTLPEVLEQSVAKYADRTALIFFGSRLSYRQLQEHVNRCAAGLQALGLRKGDRVALMMANCPQFVIAYFGALRAGAIVTATSSMYTTREAAHQWHDAGISMLIVERRFFTTARKAFSDVPSLRAVIQTQTREYQPSNLSSLERALRAQPRRSSKAIKSVSPKAPLSWPELLSLAKTPAPVTQKQVDIACLQYTGGTTGTSKGAMITHGNLVTNAYQTRHWLAREGEHETLVAALPLFHIYAMTCIMISSVVAGGTIIILPRFELKAALNVVRKYHPTIFHGVPTMYVAFNNAPGVEKYGFKSLRVCMSGGAGLPVEVQQKFEALSGGRLVEGYGLTEASPVTHVNPPDGLMKIGSIGLPIPGTDARIVDVETGTREMPIGQTGELLIRGPQVMKGYWNKEKESNAVLRDGWLYTGDIARMDEDGYFYIVDRKKDLIIAGGFNIYPREVEEVLFEHPAVQEAVVIGQPDAYRGETVKAFLVLKEGAAATDEEITSWCRERLAPYKVPREIEFRDSLPKSGVGKYLRRELRQQSTARKSAVAAQSTPSNGQPASPDQGSSNRAGGKTVAEVAAAKSSDS